MANSFIEQYENVSKVLAPLQDIAKKREKIEEEKTELDKFNLIRKSVGDKTLESFGLGQQELNVLSKSPKAGETLLNVLAGIQKTKEESPQQKLAKETELQTGKQTPLETPAYIQGQMRQKSTAEAKVSEKQMETSSKLATAVKKLSVLNRQFNDAVPSNTNDALLQRIRGNIANLGAATGVLPNAKLVALRTNARLGAIQIIRLAGEVGNLSETEQKAALDAFNQAGLTENERLEVVRQFAELALASADPKVVEQLKNNTEISDVLKAFKINIVQESSTDAMSFSSEEEARKYGMQNGDTVVINGVVGTLE